MMPLKKDCYNCEFNMADSDSVMICAGRDDSYGKPTPVPGVNYDECWEMSFALYSNDLPGADDGACGDGIIV